MPSGLAGAPATAVRLMNVVLKGLLRKCVVVYFDPLLIYSDNFNDHARHLEQVFARLKEYNLKIRLEKCSFARDSVSYLGHVITAHGVSPDPDRIKTIVDQTPPRTVKQLRSFLGMCSFFTKFIPNLAKITNPLNEHLERKELKSSSKIVWNDESQSAFELIKIKFTTAPVLVHYDPNADLELKTDSCDTAIGAILIQRITGDNGILSYYSRVLNDCEKNYSVTEKECLAVKDSIKKLRQYLHNKKFTVTTDHLALKAHRVNMCNV